MKSILLLIIIRKEGMKVQGKHEAVNIYSPFDKAFVSIDEKIADLMEAIWAHDIYTINCCQDNPEGFVWIGFFTTYDAEKFINIVRLPLYDMEPEYGDWLFSRIEGGEGKYLKPWKHKALLEDCGQVIDDTYYPEPPAFYTINIRFPVEDYKRVLYLISRLTGDENV